MTAPQTPGTRDAVDGMPAEQYHAVPALSSSGARTLIERCPLAYWYDSPFNPAREPEESTTLDHGTAIHLAILEPSQLYDRVVWVDADDWRTKAAREQRDGARLAGKVPLLAKNAEMIDGIRAAISAHPLASTLLTGGIAERSLFWTDPATGIPCKARPDYLRPDLGALVDVKSSTSAQPRAFQSKTFQMGYFQQGPWYADGIEHVLAWKPESQFFVIIEREAPYLISVGQLSQRAIEWGRMLNAKAREIFAQCAKANEWPGYPVEAWELELPVYAEYQLEDRHSAGEFSTETTRRALAAYGASIEEVA